MPLSRALEFDCNILLTRNICAAIKSAICLYEDDGCKNAKRKANSMGTCIFSKISSNLYCFEAENVRHSSKNSEQSRQGLDPYQFSPYLIREALEQNSEHLPGTREREEVIRGN